MAETRRNAADGDLDRLRRRANRRLLGAAVLLLVAIIAVPLLLEREPPLLPETVEVRIPPIEGTSFEHKLDANKSAKASAKESAKESSKAAQPASGPTPEPPAIQEPSGERVATPAAPAAPATPAATGPAGVPPAPATPPKASAKTAAAPAAPAESATPRKAGQLVVQIIAVRDPAAAKMVADRARGLKYPVYTERIDVANGVVTRVRVGPYDTKQAAEAARARLARDGFEAKVVTLQ